MAFVTVIDECRADVLFKKGKVIFVRRIFCHRLVDGKQASKQENSENYFGGMYRYTHN